MIFRNYLRNDRSLLSLQIILVLVYLLFIYYQLFALVGISFMMLFSLFFSSVDPNHVPMQYSMPPSTLLPPQQIPQNLFQQMQPSLISQESLPPGATGLPNNSRI